MTQTIRFSIAAGVMTLLTGCNPFDPYNRAETWHPTAVYDANLALMAVNPADLVYGQEPRPSDGIAATAPIERLRLDHVKPLPNSAGSSSAAPSAAGLTSN